MGPDLDPRVLASDAAELEDSVLHAGLPERVVAARRDPATPAVEPAGARRQTPVVPVGVDVGRIGRGVDARDPVAAPAPVLHLMPAVHEGTEEEAVGVLTDVELQAARRRLERALRSRF